MAEYRGDQAAGLRRLFGREKSRVVAFAAGSAGVGKSVVVANLAAALARQGKEVLVLDENSANDVASFYGSTARLDLQQAIDREKTLADVVQKVAPGVRVLPVARMVRKLGELSYPQQESLLEEISGMGHPADVILIDASLDHPLGFSPLGLAAQETVVVVSASGTSITDAYALIKKVSLAYARKDFRILVTRARAADDARAIYNNIDKLTRARGLARLSYAGYVPLDEQLRQAARLRQPVVELFPDAPAARACRAIAGDLLGWPLRDEDSGGLEQFMQQLIHLSQPPNPVAIYA